MPPSDLYNPPSSPAGPQKDRDWYSVSIESMRRAIVLLLSVIGLIGSAFAFQQWQHFKQQGEAQRVIDEATGLTHQIEERKDADQVRREFFGAWEDLDGARLAFAAGRYGDALSLGTRSLLELQQILQVDAEVTKGSGRFLDVQGQVEFRRGDRGPWRRARDQDVVGPGDWVKTSANGSAKLLFQNGPEYTLRSNTMIHMTFQLDRFGNSEQVAELPFGHVELTTDRSGSRVKTPKSEANVRRSSNAMVVFDRERNAARFAAFQGGMEIVSSSGQTQSINALQQVDQEGDVLGRATALPDRPRGLFPGEEREIDLAAGDLRLSWSRVTGAARYALNVSENRLFVSNLIDKDDLVNPGARLGIRGEGLFYWQVAAVDAEGVRGPWSEPRAFRIQRRQGNDREDNTPPPLELDSVQTYGSLLVVSGRTEPGAKLAVNGEKADLGGDGRFTKTLQMTQEGFVFVEVVATDGRGNASRQERRVFFDAAY
jgi:hypothetical protein